MIQLDLIPSKFISFRDRWSERNTRMETILDAVNGDWDVDDDDDEAIENRSPNMIQIALEDTAEASSIVPTVRVGPSGSADKAKKDAAAMERMGIAYMDAAQIELLNIRSFLDLGAYGLFTWLVTDDPETGGPLVQWRDPRTCYPEPGYKTLDSVRECFFARELYLNQLPENYQTAINAKVPDAGKGLHPNEFPKHLAHYQDKKIILIEYFTQDEWLVAALYQNGQSQPGGVITYIPIELERGTNAGGVCPVVIGQRITLDNQPRGQFDQVVGMMEAHIRLMGLVLDYADQAVYSDIWVKDLIGPLNTGGAAYIQLGPNGQIGRVQPAVTDMSVFQELASLIDSMHLGGRWPKTRPGEIDQAIASAKFVEATAGVMNTVIRTNHFIMKRAWEQALRVAFLIDKSGAEKRTVSGVLRNQQFMIERDTNDIDLDAQIRVDYGMGLGHDPASAMVLGIQAHQSGFVSREFVQENFEGITNVAQERARIDAERLRDMAMAQLLQGLDGGTIPKSALVQIAKARMDGEDIFDLFQKYVVEPMEEQMAQMPMSGLAGGPVPPTAAAPPGAGAPAAPSPEELLGGILGGGAPQGPPESASRLNIPVGAGGFMGTTSTSGGQ